MDLNIIPKASSKDEGAQTHLQFKA